MGRRSGGRHGRNTVKPLTRKVVCSLLAKNPHRFPTGADLFRECPALLRSKVRVYTFLNELKKLPLESLVQLNEDDRAEIDARKEALGVPKERPPRLPPLKRAPPTERVAAPVPRILPGPQREHPRFKTLEESLRENLDDCEDFLDIIRRNARGGKLDTKAYIDLVRLKRDMLNWIEDSAPADHGEPELVPMEAIIRRAEIRKETA